MPPPARAEQDAGGGCGPGAFRTGAYVPLVSYPAPPGFGPIWELGGGEGTVALHDAVFDSWVEPSVFHNLVVMGNPHGFVAASVTHGPNPHIRFAGVLPGARRRGLFTAIVRALIQHLRRGARFTVPIRPDTPPEVVAWVVRHRVPGPPVAAGAAEPAAPPAPWCDVLCAID